MDHDERQAWIDLWEAVFGEPPPILSEAEMAARVLVEYLPPAPPYGPREGGLKSRTG